MIKKVIVLFLVLASFLAFRCMEGDAEVEQLRDLALAYFIPLEPVNLQDSSEAFNKKVVLGRRLFTDENLSLHRNMSCASCHSLSAYGVDGKALSKGSDKSLGSRNTPSVHNAALQYAQFWDGRSESLKSQAIQPFLNAHEMGLVSSSQLKQRLREVEYCDSLDEDTLSVILNAIAAFEESLPRPTDFDRFLLGDDQALTNDQKDGLRMFIRSGCVPCHGGVGVGGQLAQEFPLYGEMKDYFQNEQEQKQLFKVPSLRNVTDTAPYFHNGAIDNLKDAVRIMGKAQTNQDLTEKEVNLIAGFLSSLSMDLPN